MSDDLSAPILRQSIADQLATDLSAIAHRQGIAEQLATDLSAVIRPQNLADFRATSSISGGVITSQEKINEKRITKIEQRLNKLEEAMYKNNTLHGQLVVNTSQQIESAEDTFANLQGVL